MSQYTSYYLYQKYQKIGTGDWTPVTPSVFSVNGNGTMPLSAKTEYDPNCGYSPEAMYRWVNMDISTNWICDDCSTPQYRTVSTAFTCVGYDKHYLDEYQVSYDSGVTWTTLSSSTGSLIETNSVYCGYVPPTPPIPTGIKFSASYSGGETYSAECDSSTTLTLNDTQPSGYNRLAIKSAAIGNCITTIGVQAFRNITGLINIYISDSVTNIGNSSFENCSSLNSVTISSAVTTIGEYAFMDCVTLTSIDIPDNVTNIGVYAFSNCSGLTSCTVGSKTIGEGAFYACSGLTSVIITDNVEAIGEFAFRYGSSITSITIGSGVTTIGGYAFEGCTSITSVTLPNTVVYIGEGAFYACSGLTSVTIPSGVTEIGGNAFKNCSGLSSIIVNASTPPTMRFRGVFDNTNNCPIYVPASSVPTYQSTSGWSAYASRITAIPNS